MYTSALLVCYSHGMRTYSTREARDNLAAIITAAKRGELVVIEQYGRPAAKVVALTDRDVVAWRHAKEAAEQENET